MRIECCPCNPSFSQCPKQGSFLHDGPACGIQQARVTRQGLKLTLADQSCGGWSERQREYQEIESGEELEFLSGAEAPVRQYAVRIARVRNQIHPGSWRYRRPG